MLRGFWMGCALLVAAAFGPLPALAGGLVTDLPPDGTWVRLEGTYKQTETRPDDTEGNLEIPEWVEHVTIKSVGTENATVDGEEVPCRWLEFRIERGREKNGEIDTGVAGLEIYKVLVPENAVGGGAAAPAEVDPAFGNDAPAAEQPAGESAGTKTTPLPASYLKIVKGFRKIGEGEPKPLNETALQLYPLGVMTGYYRNTTKGDEESVEAGADSVKATSYAGELTVERSNSRTQQTSTVWRSPDVPFGIVRWTAKVTRQVKDEQAPRDDFKTVTEVETDVKFVEKGTDAMSEIMGN